MNRPIMITVSATLAGTLILASGPATARGQGKSDSAAAFSLGDAVRAALASYPSTAAAEAQVRAARAQVGQASASWFPTLTLGFSATRFQEPMAVTPIHGFTPGEFPSFDRTLFQGSASLSYTLFDGGGRETRIRSSRYGAEAAEAGLALARAALIARTARGYLAALTRAEILTAHDRRLDALAAELARVQRLKEVGRAADVEVMRAEAAVASARADRISASSALDLARRELARLTGLPVDVLESRTLSSVVARDTTITPRDTALARALSANPAVARAGREAAAAAAGANLARSARWPRLDLVGAWVDRGSADGQFSGEWNVGMQVAYPIFTGGEVSQGIALADARRKATAEELRLAELQASEDVDRWLSAIAEAEARVASLRTAASRSAEVARIERLRLATGVGTQTDYLRAEADLLSARATLIEARHAAVVARIELARAMGSLDEGWIRDNLEVEE